MKVTTISNASRTRIVDILDVSETYQQMYIAKLYDDGICNPDNDYVTDCMDDAVAKANEWITG